MKLYLMILITVFIVANLAAQKQDSNRHLFIDVHHLTPGKVTFNDVAEAHKKDLATEGKYNVQFISYWVDEKNGDVYCLSSALDSNSIVSTHREAHGLLPDEIMMVTGGTPAAAQSNMKYFLDVHNLGAGNVTAASVADAHKKDLAVQGKYKVNFLNYWVDEKTGTVVCLSQAADSTQVINTHKEAHGLLPNSISEVKQGN